MSLAKLNFQHHYSSLQSHTSPQKWFEYADLLLKKTFLIIINVENIFWGNPNFFSPKLSTSWLTMQSKGFQCNLAITPCNYWQTKMLTHSLILIFQWCLSVYSLCVFMGSFHLLEQLGSSPGLERLAFWNTAKAKRDTVAGGQGSKLDWDLHKKRFYEVLD